MSKDCLAQKIFLSTHTHYRNTFQAKLVAHACNPGTQEAKARGPEVEGQSELPSRFKAILDYTARPCLKNPKKTKPKKKKN